MKNFYTITDKDNKQHVINLIAVSDIEIRAKEYKIIFTNEKHMHISTEEGRKLLDYIDAGK